MSRLKKWSIPGKTAKTWHSGGAFLNEENGKTKFKADSTVAGCIGLNKPIPPNVCEECRKHSDLTCEDLKRRNKNVKDR